jgi:hypothetical protein
MIKKYFLLIRGFIRCRIFNFCPKCNSDAPEKDTCSICDDAYGYPTRAVCMTWWLDYKDELND